MSLFMIDNYFVNKEELNFRMIKLKKWVKRVAAITSLMIVGLFLVKLFLKPPESDKKLKM